MTPTASSDPDRSLQAAWWTMSLLDDLLSRIRATGDAVATDAATQAARLAAEKAANEALDDVERHLVGDLGQVQQDEADLNAKARARMAKNESTRAAVHTERMARKDRAAAELAALKAARDARAPKTEE